MNRWLGALVVFSAVALSVGGTVQGSVKLLDSPGDSAWIDGVLFWVPSSSVGNIPSGTASFLRFKDTTGAQQSGFNTTYTPWSGLTPLPDDMTHSYALPTSSIPQLGFGGTTYREFLLSVQEPGSTTIQLNELELAPTHDPAVQDFTSLASVTIIGGGTDTIEVSSVYGGTNIDVLMYVPTTSSAFSDDYVVMYNLFDSAADGPDEWGVNEDGPLGTIPEPSSYIVWSLLGALGMIVAWRRRRRNAA